MYKRSFGEERELLMGDLSDWGNILKYMLYPVALIPSFRGVDAEFTIIVFPVSKNEPRAILLVYSWDGWWVGGGIKENIRLET